jgi:hypothetical protein
VATIADLKVDGKVIRTTLEHPFYERQRGWVAVRELQVGDELSSHDGQWIKVEEVRETGEWETVYNIRVSECHTYFVGTPEWSFSVWAHNISCPNPGAIRDAVDTIEGIDPKRAKNIATYAQSLIQEGKGDTKVIDYLIKQGVKPAVATRGVEASKHERRHGKPITPEMQEWADKHGLKLIDPGDPENKDLRTRYMGDTPEKGSEVHTVVVDRMLADGKLRVNGGVVELAYLDPATNTTKWINIKSKDVHMGHLEDAVTFWNTIGRFTGAKSAEVRKFMTDPNKYELQYRSNNIAAGNKIPVREYLPTPIATLPVVD